ncbi:MAG: hypothetical protein HZC40_17460 [Chloroflexi bacterium]|nr:hypothetical protein [Chloroflexota bacterium]
MLPSNAKCHYCGNLFHRSPSELKRKDVKHAYCSRECYDRARRAGIAAQRQPVEWATENQIPCDYCGKLIHKTPSKLRDHKHHFCSAQCMGYFSRANNLSTLHEIRDDLIEQVNGTCQICTASQKSDNRRRTSRCASWG